jgi:serine/threonine protein kinase
VRTYTHEVVTLWYRAPEILLGACLRHGAAMHASAHTLTSAHDMNTRLPLLATGAKHYSTPVDIWCAPTAPRMPCQRFALLLNSKLIACVLRLSLGPSAVSSLR